MEAQYTKGKSKGNEQKNHIHSGICNHPLEAQKAALPSKKFHKIVNKPAANNGIKGNQRHVSNQAYPSKDAPFLPLVFQLLVHMQGAALGGSPNGEFHHQRRNAQNHQTDKINQHKAAAAVLSAHPGKFPHVAAPNGTSRRQHDKAQAAAQGLPLHVIALHSFYCS